jgi:hypothetical protein
VPEPRGRRVLRIGFGVLWLFDGLLQAQPQMAAGLFFPGMAVMQAWPGNGFWRGGSGGPLASRVATMARTPQPHVIARLVANFGRFTAGDAFAVNLAVVIVLAAVGLALGAVPMAAASANPSGELLAGGACDNPGMAGIFGYSDGAWHPAGPDLPGILAGDRVEVLRLTATPAGNVALLVAGPDLLAAWTSDGGARWTVTPPLAVGAAGVSSAAFGSGGAVGVLLPGGKTATVDGPGSSWQSLPAAPPGTAVLAFAPSAAGSAMTSQVDALSAKGS